MTDTSDHPRFVFRGGEHWRSPWDDYRTLRDHAPVHFVGDHDLPFFVLSRFEDVFTAARDTTLFSSARGLVPEPDAMAMFDGVAVPIVMMDPPDHTTMRRLVSRQMTPRRIAALEPALVTFVDDRLDELVEAGGGDIVETLFKPLPSFVVAHLLGVPDTDRDRFDGWTQAIVAANASGDVTGVDATVDLATYALELIEYRRSNPGEDLVSDLVRQGEDIASTLWIVGFVFTMVTGGNDTTTGLLGGAAELLTARPDQRQLLLDEPAAVRPSVDEFLRLTSPVQNLARTVTQSTTLHGVDIPEGTMVMLLYGAANRDEREFGPDADELDVVRVPPRTLALGSGAHHCLGAAAARLQASVALERLLARCPGFTVDAEAGVFASGPYVRRYESLPFSATGAG